MKRKRLKYRNKTIQLFENKKQILTEKILKIDFEDVLDVLEDNHEIIFCNKFLIVVALKYKTTYWSDFAYTKSNIKFKEVYYKKSKATEIEFYIHNNDFYLKHIFSAFDSSHWHGEHEYNFEFIINNLLSLNPSEKDIDRFLIQDEISKKDFLKKSKTCLIKY